MDTQEYLQSLVDAARAAQKEFEKMSQEHNICDFYIRLHLING